MKKSQADMHDEDYPEVSDAISGELQSLGFDDDSDEWLAFAQQSQQFPSLGGIGDYEILREAGRGGQGIVYQAQNTETGQLVAIKRILPGMTTARIRDRFQRESKLISRLKHPNIVNCLDQLEANGDLYLVMEWIEGDDVAAWSGVRRTDVDAHGSLRECRNLEELLNLFVQICHAVQYAHEHNVIHRDIKPSNIIVDGQNVPHLLDFGLARIFHDESLGSTIQSATNTQFAGTLAYASPEQFLKPGHELDGRADVYALGVVLFEMLTGQLPHETNGPIAEVISEVCERAPRPAQLLAPGLPDGLYRVLNCALAKHPSQRYATPMALADDVLNSIHQRPLQAAKPSTVSLLRILYRKNRAASILAILIVALLGVGFVSTAWLANSAMTARDRERAQRDVAEKTVSFLSGMLAQANPRHRGGAVRVVDILEDAADRVESELADAPRASADVYRTIGKTYYSLWLTARSEKYFRRALEIYREQLGPDHALVAATQRNLGAVLSFQDDKEAITLQRDALRINRLLYGDAHPLIASTMHDLAFAIYRGTRPPDFEAAETTLLRAQAMRREIYGEAHASVNGGMHLLAAMRSRQGRHEESTALYQEVIQRMSRTLPDDDPALIECLADYGEALTRAGQFERALQVLDEVVHRTRDSFGSSWSATPRFRQGLLHFKMQAVELAEKTMREALQLYLARIVDHPQAVMFASRTVAFEQDEYWDKLRRLLVDLPIDQHPDPNLFTEILLGLARCRLSLGDHDRAVQIATAACTAREAYLDSNHWRNWKAKRVLAQARIKRGPPDAQAVTEARNSLKDGCDFAIRAFGESSPQAKALCED
ncbi:MAG: protein kinase domain-containing protein [Phycisphaerae bacterium]